MSVQNDGEGSDNNVGGRSGDSDDNSDGGDGDDVDKLSSMNHLPMSLWWLR